MKWLLAALVMLGSWTPLKASGEKEPPLGYTLLIGGEKVALEPGKEVRINGKFENPAVTLVPDLERRFEGAGVSFKYPAYFTFAADFTTEGIRIWTLSGKDHVIMLQAMADVKPTAQEMADAIKTQYGKGATTKPVSRKIGAHQLEGVRVEVNLAGVDLTQEVLPLPAASAGGSRFLILQDMAAPDKMTGEEKQLVEELLGQTLTLTDPPAPPGKDR